MEIVISKLLFPSTLLFLEKTKKKWNGMEGNSNAGLHSFGKNQRHDMIDDKFYQYTGPFKYYVSKEVSGWA